MPASVLGSQFSWALYLFAAAGLVVVLSPSLSGTAAVSRHGAELRVLEGVRSVLEGVGPGVHADFSLGSYGTTEAIVLHGHVLSLVDGNSTLSLACSASLGNATLSLPGSYEAVAKGGVVEVSPLG